MRILHIKAPVFMRNFCYQALEAEGYDASKSFLSPCSPPLLVLILSTLSRSQSDNKLLLLEFESEANLDDPCAELYSHPFLALPFSEAIYLLIRKAYITAPHLFRKLRHEDVFDL